MLPPTILSDPQSLQSQGRAGRVAVKEYKIQSLSRLRISIGSDEYKQEDLVRQGQGVADHLKLCT